MRKTMIYLPESQHERLRRLASERDTSLAGLIREAVELYLGRQDHQPKASFIGTGAGPEGGDASQRVDEILREMCR